jgi:UDP-glucose 4-epimerase
MSRWLITGGAGFIGSHLADALLARGDLVRVLDNLDSGKLSSLTPGVEFVQGDVTERADVRAGFEGVDGCFHLAAIASVERSTQQWASAHRTNLSGAIEVFEAARDAAGGPKPVVYASSCAVFGDQDTFPLREDSAVRPISAYGADKLGCEQHARIGGHIFGLPTVGLRFFNVYGPRQDPASPYSGVIAKFLKGVASGEPLMIFGDGLQKRDFVYVADAVAHLVASMDWLGSGRPGTSSIFNVCTGVATTILDLVSTIERASGAPAVVNQGPARTGDIRVSLGDPTLATKVLGLKAQTPLEAGIRLTMPRAIL